MMRRGGMAVKRGERTAAKTAAAACNPLREVELGDMGGSVIELDDELAARV